MKILLDFLVDNFVEHRLLFAFVTKPHQRIEVIIKFTSAVYSLIHCLNEGVFFNKQHFIEITLFADNFTTT